MKSLEKLIPLVAAGVGIVGVVLSGADSAAVAAEVKSAYIPCGQVNDGS
jgi:hypothetical protein